MDAMGWHLQILELFQQTTTPMGKLLQLQDINLLFKITIIDNELHYWLRPVFRKILEDEQIVVTSPE